MTVAGADANVEGLSAQDTAARFSELVRLVGMAGVRRLRLLLVGPAVVAGTQSATMHMEVMRPGQRPLVLANLEGTDAQEGGHESTCGLASEDKEGSAGGWWWRGSPSSTDEGLGGRAPRGEVPVASCHFQDPGSEYIEGNEPSDSFLARTADFSETLPKELITLRIAYASCHFHDQGSLSAGPGADLGDLDSSGHPPHLVACFNAGVWWVGFALFSLSSPCKVDAPPLL